MKVDWVEILKNRAEHLPNLGESPDTEFEIISDIHLSGEVMKALQDYYNTKDPVLLTKIELLIRKENPYLSR